MAFSRFKQIRQHDSMECGVACLSMICRYHGIRYDMDELSELCSLSAEGVSLLALRKTADKIGFDTISARASVEDLIPDMLPCILHWNQNHFVVLYKVSRNKRQFHIADPGKGKIKYNDSDLQKHWVVGNSNKGIALFMARRNEASNENRKIRDNVSLSFLWGYIKKYRKYFSHIILGLMLGCLLQLILPFLTQGIVDFGIKYDDIGLIWLILLGEFMIVAGRTATDFIRRWLLLHISMRINISLVSDFFLKLLKLPMSFFDTKLMGDLLQRIGDHSRVQNFLTQEVLNVLFSSLSFLVFGFVLLVYSPLVFCVFLAGSVCYGLWIALFLKRRKVLDYELFEQQAVNQNRTYQFITTMQEIKLQDCERRRRFEWEDTQADLFEVQMKSLKLQQAQEAGSIFINEIKNILITVFAATAVINGELSLGAMLAIQYIVGQLNTPIAQFMQFVYSLQDVKISLERINEIHNGKNEESESRVVKEFTGEKSILLKGVNFKYDRHALKNTLEDMSIEIPAGKVTAIVGASGSGKTTLVKLMLGYYSVTEGTLKITGQNIEDYNLKWWRKQCGVVMQDGVIFSESIERNIAVDDEPIDATRLEQAARIANIHDYIMSLPLRYETKIGPDGIGLSQGQRQRILIARAVYKNPSFIFLDEATNALDAKNERTIVENLDKFYKGKTVVIVAHRLSTVRNADQIIVLDSGKVVETGNHDNLIIKRGYYYNLIKNQLELGA